MATNRQDSKTPLSQICQGDASVLTKQVINIQEYTTSREKSVEWAEKLRFLYLGDIYKNRQSKRIQLLRQTSYHQHPYMAVSYRWQLAENPSYLIIDDEGTPRPNKVSNRLLDRVICYALKCQIKYLWIDQECMDQGDNIEKEIGIQAMDLVYLRSQRPVGLLNLKLETKQQWELLKRLLQKGKPIAPKFDERMSQDFIFKSFALLRYILEDEWWQRTWIFQEEYCGATKMDLLIPYDLKDGNSFPDGSTTGDNPIKPVSFRRTVTLFCLACERLGYPCSDILQKAKRYNLLNRTNPTSKDTPTLFTGFSIDMMIDINERQNDKVMDRLAIIANCCDYSRRLDGNRLEERTEYNLSACILCLFFLNGEILSSPHFSSGQEPSKRTDFLSLTAHEFLKQRVLRIASPGQHYQASFTKYCRLPEVRLIPDGLETCGWLWNLGEPIPLWIPESLKDRPVRNSNLTSTDFSLLENLTGELRKRGYSGLSDRIQDFTTKDNEQSRNPGSGRWFQEQMIQAMTDGIKNGKCVRIATLLGQEEPAGVFICEPQAKIPSSKVFTAWSNEGGKYLEKYVSIAVEFDAVHPLDRPYLHTCDWINGLWFANRSEGFRKVLFPWPF